MITWDFRTIQIASGGVAELAALAPEQQARAAGYQSALETAAASEGATPLFSGYRVKTSIVLPDGNRLSGSNTEYGFCRSLHAEEAVAVAFHTRYGRTDSKGAVLGIMGGNPGQIPTPCGNCRDILRDTFASDLEIVSGAPGGGIAIVASLTHYLFSKFKTLPVTNLTPEVVQKIGMAIEQGKKLVNDAYSPEQIHPGRRYHAFIVTRGNVFVGARDVMCEFHPIYALRDAIRQARRANDPFVQYVVIVCEDFGGGPPDVMYMDRQHLAELNLQAELLGDHETDPPVFLVTQDNQGRISGAWQTSVKEWIPLVFTPRHFGEEFMGRLTRYFRGRERQ